MKPLRINSIEYHCKGFDGPAASGEGDVLLFRHEELGIVAEIGQEATIRPAISRFQAYSRSFPSGLR